MYTPRHRRARFFFGLADALLLTLAFAAAYQTRLLLPLERGFAIALANQVLLVLFAILVHVAIGVAQGFYERLESLAPWEAMAGALWQTVQTFTALVVFEYFLRLDLSRPFLALYFGYGVLGTLAFRANIGGIAQWIRREYGAPVRIVVIGEEAAREAWVSEVRPHLGNVELIGLGADQAALEVPRLLQSEVIDEIVLAVDARELGALDALLLLCDEEGVKTRLALDLFPHVHSDVYLDQVGTSRLLTFAATPQDDLRLIVKRGMDIAGSLAALILLAPLFVVLAIAIKMTSSGPVLYKQIRCGLNGRRFVFYKFRSMVNGADQMLDQVAHLNTKKTAFKAPNDPRLTPIGRFLRKYSLDELPQFWNVLKGDMSLVGPRPPVPGEVEKYERWQRRRLRMRPGLTCLWALRGRDSVEFESWMRMDMEYIDSWSLGLDVMILLRTVPSVISGKGAH